MTEMLNTKRRDQYLHLMGERGWDHLLLYGHAWRKDFFRCLVNFNFFGPHAPRCFPKPANLASSRRTPGTRKTWPASSTRRSPGAGTSTPRSSRFARPGTAVAGIEFMEARFVEHCPFRPLPQLLAVEELRRVKTPEEIASTRRAAHLADVGYQHFVDTARVGMAEYELVAEVEGFLKTNGVEHNFMLIAIRWHGSRRHEAAHRARFQKGDAVTTELTRKSTATTRRSAARWCSANHRENQRRSFDMFPEANRPLKT